MDPQSFTQQVKSTNPDLEKKDVDLLRWKKKRDEEKIMESEFWSTAAPLNTKLYEEYVSFLGPDEENREARKGYLCAIENNNILKTQYYSWNNEGRMYGVGPSLAKIDRKSRAVFMYDTGAKD